MNPVTVDVVGCGEAMVRFHVPALRALRDEGLVAPRRCFDPAAERAAQVARVLGAEARAGTGDGQAEAVVVASPPEHHLAGASAYVERGAVALVEKPATTGAAALDALLDAAARGGGRVLVGHLRRLSPAVQAARAAVAAGLLGRLERVEAGEGFRWRWNAASDYFVRSPFGGVAFDTGSHVVDAVAFVLGADTDDGAGVDVVSVEKDPPREPSHALRAELVVTTAAHGALPVRLILSRREPVAGQVRLVGEAGMLVVPAHWAPHATLWLGREPLELAPGRDAAAVVSPARESQFVTQARLLVRVASDRSARTVLDVERSRFTVRVLEQLGKDGG